MSSATSTFEQPRETGLLSRQARGEFGRLSLAAAGCLERRGGEGVGDAFSWNHPESTAVACRRGLLPSAALPNISNTDDERTRERRRWRANYYNNNMNNNSNNNTEISGSHPPLIADDVATPDS